MQVCAFALVRSKVYKREKERDGEQRLRVVCCADKELPQETAE